MILFQLTLSGHMLRLLAAISEQDTVGIEVWEMNIPNIIASSHALQRERLITHEQPIHKVGEPDRFRTKGRKHAYEITPKGRLALELAAIDLGGFLAEVKGDRPPIDTRASENVLLREGRKQKAKAS